MNNRIAAKRNSGFTLMELLVVMAISMVLMGLVMAPVINSFQMTRRAQAMVDAQDAARAAMEKVSREIGEAMDVLDYSADTLEIPVYDPAAPNNPYYKPIPFAKIDLVMPRMIVHCYNEAEDASGNPQHNPSEPRDFERDDLAVSVCPVCGSTDVEVKPRLPIEQGSTVVRYFLGLRYNDPNPPANALPPHPGWQSPWAKGVLADEGNQVVLYRLEFNPNDESIFGKDKDVAAERLMDVLKDSRFFYRDDSPHEGGANWRAADNRPLWQHWAEKARVLGIAKYEDLVTGTDSDNDGKFDALHPSVGFRFAKIDNDTFIGVDYGNLVSEYPDAPPSAFRAKHGYWTPNSYAGVTLPLGISAYRYAQDSSGNVSTADTVMYYTIQGGDEHLVIMRRQGNNPPTQVFDITEYMYNGAAYGLSGMVDINSIDSNTDMGFFFDFAQGAGGQLVNFNRGMVNFALNVEPVVLKPEDIDGINMAFAAQLADNRSPLPRRTRVPALDRLPNATVVPGSEVIMGPDMTPGATPGSVVRYARVSLELGSAGLNEYQINYKTGDIFFSPVVKQDLPVVPNTNMRIDYKIQFNKDGDVVMGNYQTKALIDIRIGIRMYDPESRDPHVVELNSRAQVRNAYR